MRFTSPNAVAHFLQINLDIISILPAIYFPYNNNIITKPLSINK